jgi:hypothetical protein
MVQIEKALLEADKPDLGEVATLVSGVMTQYNAVVSDVQREARGRQ